MQHTVVSFIIHSAALYLLITAFSLLTLKSNGKYVVIVILNLFFFFFSLLQLALAGFNDGSDDKESACNAGDQVQSLGQEDPLEKEMATRSSILAWKIPWTEESGGL